MNGFFQSSIITAKKSIEYQIPRCGSCGIYKSCKSPKMPVTGEGKKGILLLGEAPGADEDDQNKQFVGKAGQTLRSTLNKFDIDLDRDCWKTNSLICRPTETDKETGIVSNRTPTPDEINYCRPNLTKAIKELNPRIIIPLGGIAVKSLLGPLWREDTGPVSKWVGWKIPLRKYNAWVTPTYHSSYINRSENLKEGSVIKLWFERHIEAAVGLKGRPWNVILDFKNEIEIIMDSKVARERILNLIESGKAFAWDIETNKLKPDSNDAEIVCCSMSTGDETFAYPWVGNAIDATGKLLISNNPKIGFNAKFESRWIKAKLGIDVKNWVWDGMLSAHHLDNRAGICSAKFQGFIRLGMSPWDEHIKPYLQSTNENGLNRIRELDMRSLLIYCALDSLIEYKISQIQRKEMRNE